MALSLTQRRALAIAPKFTGLLSMIGSGIIMWDVLSNPKKRKQTYSRIMLGMSSFDFVLSFMYFLSTWPIPAGSGPLYAVGTMQSCTFQGFFIQLSLAVPMYNLFLAAHYLLVIEYEWSDFQLAKIERLVHPAIFTFSFGIAIAGLPLKIYNNANVWCWIAPNPSDPSRGNNANIYRWAFYYVELWSIIFAISVIMLLVVFSVKRTEVRASYLHLANGSSMTQQTRRQAIYYVSAFYITWVFPTTLRIIQTVGAKVPYAIFLCTVIFLPLQGFWNSILYLKPLYLQHRKAMKKRKSKRRSQHEDCMPQASITNKTSLEPTINSTKRSCQSSTEVCNGDEIHANNNECSEISDIFVKNNDINANDNANVGAVDKFDVEDNDVSEIDEFDVVVAMAKANRTDNEEAMAIAKSRSERVTGQKAQSYAKRRSLGQLG